MGEECSKFLIESLDKLIENGFTINAGVQRAIPLLDDQKLKKKMATQFLSITVFIY